MFLITKVLKSGDRMKRTNKKILVLEIIFLIFLLFNSFVLKNASTLIMTAISFLFLGVMFFMFGYEKDNFRNKNDVLLNLLICLLLYYFVTYFLGFFTGFIRSSYSMTLINIIKNTLPIIALIIVTELLRYEIVTKTKDDLKSLIIGCILFVMMDINLSVHLYDVTTAIGITKMVCLVLFPSVTKNIFLIFLNYKAGYKIGILYRLLTELSVYLIPISPDFGEYLNVLLKTILPIIIMVRLNNMYNYFEMRKIKNSRYNNSKMILYSIITFILFIVVMLTSGLFKYQALTIGSGSMYPTIEKGDVVIVSKVEEKEMSSIQKGDILVYKHDNIILVHRVVEIKTNNKEFSFRTKGDNNSSKDSWTIKQSDVIGTVKLKIKWLGIPTVSLNELLNK